METSGTPIQDNVGLRMQLQYTRQGTTGNSSGIPRMETIHEGNSEASAGPYRPQELSNLHDNHIRKM